MDNPFNNKEVCFHVAKLDKEEAAALKALGKGEAQAWEQTLALSVICNKFARPHDLTFIPNERDQSSFMSGRAFVGMEILKVLKKPIGQYEEDKDV